MAAEDTATRNSTQSRMMIGPGERELGSAYLLVVEGARSTVVHLPREGEVVIGRGSDTDLRPDAEDASLSRRHAAIRVTASAIRIGDLGSHNGTRVNGERLAEREWRTLASGDVIKFGDNLVCVVHLSNPPIVSRPALPEDGWRQRLSEEIERAVRYRRSLAVLSLTGVTPAAVAELGEAVRLIDVVGAGESDGKALLLMPEVERDEACATARTLIDALRTGHPAVRGGIAMCPSDACDADTILLAARNAARQAAKGTLVEASSAVTRIELGDKTVLVLDPAMIRVYDLLQRLAVSKLPVLITGETGVGKENAAWAVHFWSKRTGKFRAQNCANLETLAESTLFGHAKGAFTGASSAAEGLFESAAGGTVFLDEVGEIPLAIQAKLLRALENKVITRVGETAERPIDVRVVAATNRNLDVEVLEGRFREDLLARLEGALVILPPLRDRRCEIPMLARMFLDGVCESERLGRKVITPEAMRLLLCYEWPGNVRELRNAMERASVTAPDERVEPTDLPDKVTGATSRTSSQIAIPALDPAPDPDAGPRTFRSIADEIRDLERTRMVEALAAAGGTKTRAALLIQMPIRTFTLKLKQYGL